LRFDSACSSSSNLPQVLSRDWEYHELVLDLLGPREWLLRFKTDLVEILS